MGFQSLEFWYFLRIFQMLERYGSLPFGNLWLILASVHQILQLYTKCCWYSTAMDTLSSSENLASHVAFLEATKLCSNLACLSN